MAASGSQTTVMLPRSLRTSRSSSDARALVSRADAPIAPDMFETKLASLATAALGAPEPGRGVSAEVLHGVERRLGVMLPVPLRYFYSLLGASPEAMRSHHSFVEPAELDFTRDGLVLCYEQQRQMFWAVLRADLGHSDPRVVQGQPGSVEWWGECRELSTFLLNFACWQMVNGMPEVGRASLGATTLRTLKRRLKVVSATMSYNMAALADPSTGVLASVLLDSGQVYLGGRTAAALEALAHATSIEFDSL